MQHRLRWIIGFVACFALGLLNGCLPNPEGLATDVLGIANTPTLGLTPPTPVVTPLPTPSPFSFPATINPTPICDGAPPSRLIVGERARITDEDPTDLNVRADPGATKDNPPIGKLRVGEVVIVLDGPVCSDRYAWYEVDTGDVQGWIAEGDLELYYVEPFLGQ